MSETTRTDLISKAELLGGLRGKDKRRAAIVSSLIEARAARLISQRHSLKAPLMTESAFNERSRAFLSAIAEGARETAIVSIQELEQTAEQWYKLVPDNPGVRAEIARRWGQKYTFSKTQIPRISAALGLDDSRVQSAFENGGDWPLSAIYVEPQRWSPDSIKWTWSRLVTRIEGLPPFWTAFALTLTETVGAGTLALPIAFATVGPLAGVVLLVLLGLVNLITVAYIAEASARNSAIRYGSAFVGRLVEDYLGVPASIVLRVALFAFCCIILASYYTGFASTLSAVTGIAAPVWVTVIFATGLFLILRKTLLGTLASALLTGFINLTILLLLSLLALSHATPENLLHADLPYIDGRTFEASHLQLIFGIVLVSYFGHLSVSNCAQAVLRRDPKGRSLKLGTITAMLVAIFIYSIWSISIGGAVASDNLLGETGTVLAPLAEQIGPHVYLPGLVFAVLGLGMSSVHFGLGIYNISRELSVSPTHNRPMSWFSRQRTAILSSLPLLAVFGYVQWTFFQGTPSFTAPLEVIGAILTPVLAGIYPALLLLASRAQGLPARSAKLGWFASNKFVLSFVIALSFSGLLIHGLVIWQAPLHRAIALGTTAVMFLLILDLIRRKSFAPTINLDIGFFPDQAGCAKVTLAQGGETVGSAATVLSRDGTETPLASDGLIKNFRDCQSISFDIPKNFRGLLRVNARSISAEHEADALMGYISFSNSDKLEEVGQLCRLNGFSQLAVPTDHGRVSITTNVMPQHYCHIVLT